MVENGVRCHAFEAGSGPPLVLLHGTAIDSAALAYGPSREQLAVRHRVLALDWPGYGRSEHPRALPTMDDTVALLEAFLDAMGLARVHLAGFSMGSRGRPRVRAALAGACRQPDRDRRVRPRRRPPGSGPAVPSHARAAVGGTGSCARHRRCSAASCSGSRGSAIEQSLITACEVAWPLERRSEQRQPSTGRARAAPISARPMQRSSRRRAG